MRYNSNVEYTMDLSYLQVTEYTYIYISLKASIYGYLEYNKSESLSRHRH